MRKSNLWVAALLLIGTLASCQKNEKNEKIEKINGKTVAKMSSDKSVVNVPTFKNIKVAFGDGFNQSAEGTFVFPSNVENVETIKMYIKDICPNKTCDEWDRYANLYVKNQSTGIWYEIGRFITPYWVGNEKLKRGLEIDVTDFKSLLVGNVELKIYTETWNTKGRTYTIDFDVHYGTPEYKYSAIAPLIQYNSSSIDGVPYGKAHNFDLTRQFQLPSGTEKAYLRSTISGWGHASSGNCAEWCFRTHHIAINSTPTFTHKLAPLGCANNPVNNQNPGNWKPDRAGWCPGMAVPIRLDELHYSLFNSKINYEYQFEKWVNNNKNGDAFYAISSFVVVKSNEPISEPTVIN